MWHILVQCIIDVHHAILCYYCVQSHLVTTTNFVRSDVVIQIRIVLFPVYPLWWDHNYEFNMNKDNTKRPLYYIILNCIRSSLASNGSIKTYMSSLAPPSHARQNGHFSMDGIFKCIFMNEKFCVLITISLKCVFNGSIDNNPAMI